MDIIKLARELGKELQKDEKYTAYQTAMQNSDADEALQAMIGDFNMKRMAINAEAQKEDRDEATLAKLNEELREVYASIMQNENMEKYNVAKGEIDALVQRVMAIIGQSSEGADPETCDLEPQGCSGSCSSCSGCH